MSGFICDKCGHCCRMLKGIQQLEPLDRGDGICIHLRNNLCDIYENRPEICNVELMFQKAFSDQMSREDFEDVTRQACELIKQENHKCERSVTQKDLFPLLNVDRSINQ